MRFLIARNPDQASRLPYLLRLPIDGGLVLKARETWPRTSRVFCARSVEDWPSDPEIVEEIAVLSCRRRGISIDLSLDRPRENLSQFVFTTLPDGREGIFWQTRKVVGTARPGARIPGRRASGLSDLQIVVDSREHYPYRFARQQTETVRAALAAGDYAVQAPDGSIIAAVERKALADLTSGLANGTLIFELSRLAALPRAAVVVEDRYSKLLEHPYAPAGFLPDLLARVQVRYREIPIIFLENRALAEEWTFRYLGAALADAGPEDNAASVPLNWDEPGPRTAKKAARTRGAGTPPAARARGRDLG